MNSYRGIFVVCAVVSLGLFSSTTSYAEEATNSREQVETIAETPSVDSGNKELFSAQPRELVLPPGSQDTIALSVLTAFLALGIFELIRSGAYFQFFVTFIGVCTVYSGWIHHKWVISGHFPIGTGHLISLGIFAAGVTVATLGVLLLKFKCVPDNTSSGQSTSGEFSRGFAVPAFFISLIPLAPYALIFSLGVVTGHATIFEAAPTIFGQDMQLHNLALMTAMGCAAITSSILFYIRGLGRIRFL